MPLRQVQALPLQGHHLRQVRGRGHPRARCAASGWVTSGWLSPVSHVWYFKGIPSRAGTACSTCRPRNLEKVLYFANYIVTQIDEEARTKELAELDPERSDRIKELRQAAAEQSEE